MKKLTVSVLIVLSAVMMVSAAQKKESPQSAQKKEGAVCFLGIFCG